MTDPLKIQEMLSAYLDGELTETQVRQVESAVSGNAELAEELRQLRELRMMLSDVPAAKAPEGFADCVLEIAERKHLLGLNQEHATRHVSRWISTAAAAVVLLVAGAVLTVIMQLEFNTPKHSRDLGDKDAANGVAISASDRESGSVAAEDRYARTGEALSPSRKAYAAKAKIDSANAADALGAKQIDGEAYGPWGMPGAPATVAGGVSVEREDAVLAVAVGKPTAIPSADKVVIWADSVDDAISTLNSTFANNKLNTIRLVNNENVPVTMQSVRARGVSAGRASRSAGGDEPVEAQIVLWAPPAIQRGVSAEVRRLPVEKYSWKTRSVSSTPNSVSTVQNSQMGYAAEKQGSTVVARKRVRKEDTSRRIRNAAGRPVAIERTKRTITIDQETVVTRLSSSKGSSLVRRKAAAGVAADTKSKGKDVSISMTPVKSRIALKKGIAKTHELSVPAGSPKLGTPTIDSSLSEDLAMALKEKKPGVDGTHLARMENKIVMPVLRDQPTTDGKRETEEYFDQSANLRAPKSLECDMNRASWYETGDLLAIGQNKASLRGFVAKPLVIIVKVRPDAAARALARSAVTSRPAKPTTQPAKATSQPASMPADATDAAKKQ